MTGLSIDVPSSHRFYGHNRARDWGVIDAKMLCRIGREPLYAGQKVTLRAHAAIPWLPPPPPPVSASFDRMTAGIFWIFLTRSRLRPQSTSHGHLQVTFQASEDRDDRQGFPLLITVVATLTRKPPGAQMTRIVKVDVLQQSKQ